MKISVQRVCGPTLLYFYLIFLTNNVVSSGEIACHAIRYIFHNKNLDVSEVPTSPRQGIHLQICPRGETCCTREMETKLWTVSRETYTNTMANSAKHIIKLFQNKSKMFDEFFTSLLTNSKREFHLMFKKTYGILYERNSDVFTDFFKELENYYENGNVDLEEALKRFFTHLYQRMFTVLNSQYTFDNKYLQCVSENMQKLQPFGDVPKKLTLQLRRSFVATRTFAQALLEGKKILTRVLKISPSDKCVDALTRMTSCPSCQGLPAIRPCTNYCLNVMKGCLAYHTELSDTWDNYIDSLISVGERLVGPFNIEAVVEPIDIKISDAIMNFQESGFEVTQKVFEDCGRPRLGRRQAISNNAFSYNRLSAAAGSAPQMPPAEIMADAAIHSNVASGSRMSLDTLVNDIMTNVKGTKGYWIRLPYILCQNPEVGSGKESVEQNCWNGRERGTYTQRLMADGLAAQDQNPEVTVDSSIADTNINEQIFALRLVINKLESAYNGHTVKWPHYEAKYPNDSGYEGSGDCYDDEDCEVEGSGAAQGSGDGPWDDDLESWDQREGSGSRPEGSQAPGNQEPESKWPPWVTDKTRGGSAGDNNNGSSDDIEIDDSVTSHDGQSTPQRGEASSAHSLMLSTRTLLHYALPVLICWLGGCFI